MTFVWFLFVVDGGVTTSVIVTSFSFSYKLLNVAQVKMLPISILEENIRKNIGTKKGDPMTVDTQLDKNKLNRKKNEMK